MAGDEKLGFNNAVFVSERDAGDRNYALAFLMREHSCYPTRTRLRTVMDLYFQVDKLTERPDGFGESMTKSRGKKRKVPARPFCNLQRVIRRLSVRPSSRQLVRSCVDVMLDDAVLSPGRPGAAMAQRKGAARGGAPPEQRTLETATTRQRGLHVAAHFRI